MLCDNPWQDNKQGSGAGSTHRGTRRNGSGPLTRRRRRCRCSYNLECPARFPERVLSGDATAGKGN